MRKGLKRPNYIKPYVCNLILHFSNKLFSHSDKFYHRVKSNVTHANKLIGDIVSGKYFPINSSVFFYQTIMMFLSDHQTKLCWKQKLSILAYSSFSHNVFLFRVCQLTLYFNNCLRVATYIYTRALLIYIFWSYSIACQLYSSKIFV